MKNNSYSFCLLVVCLLAVCLMASCSLFDSGSSCDHDWVTSVTGGVVDCTGANHVVTSACTVTKTCSKCNAVVGSNINPTADLFFEDDGEGDICVGYGSSTATSVVIPQKVILDPNDGAVDITYVGDFDGKNIKSVMVSGSATSGGASVTIGDNAFDGCHLLESVYLGDAVSSIKSNAFKNCFVLSYVRFGSDFAVSSMATTSFMNCYGLREIYPATVYNSSYFSDSYVLVSQAE